MKPSVAGSHAARAARSPRREGQGRRRAACRKVVPGSGDSRPAGCRSTGKKDNIGGERPRDVPAADGRGGKCADGRTTAAVSTAFAGSASTSTQAAVALTARTGCDRYRGRGPYRMPAASPEALRRRPSRGARGRSRSQSRPQSRRPGRVGSRNPALCWSPAARRSSARAGGSRGPEQRNRVGIDRSSTIRDPNRRPPPVPRNSARFPPSAGTDRAEPAHGAARRHQGASTDSATIPITAAIGRSAKKGADRHRHADQHAEHDRGQPRSAGTRQSKRGRREHPGGQRKPLCRIRQDDEARGVA